jgi:hypothetical protein
MKGITVIFIPAREFEDDGKSRSFSFERLSAPAVA